MSLSVELRNADIFSSYSQSLLSSEASWLMKASVIVEFKGPELLVFCLTICLPRVCFGPNVSIGSLEVLAFTIQLINYCICVCFRLAINVLTIFSGISF